MRTPKSQKCKAHLHSRSRWFARDRVFHCLCRPLDAFRTTARRLWRHGFLLPQRIPHYHPVAQQAEHQQSINLKNFYLRRLLRIFRPCYVTVVIVSSLAYVGLLYNTESYRSLPTAFLYFSNYWNILGLAIFLRA